MKKFKELREKYLEEKDISGMSSAEHESAIKKHNEKAFYAGHAHDSVMWKKHTDMAAKHADALGKTYTKTGYGIKIEGAQTMSRAAKGHEKYGKEGMQALSKAGKEGKDLDKVRAKYNKYDDKLTKEDVAEAKDVSAFDWKSKVKAPQSSFASKKISTGTVYTKKYKAETDDADDMKKDKKSKAMGEGVTQTIINHNDFVLEVTDNPTFKDYFNAIQSIVPSSNEEIQKELVTIATEAYNEGYDDIILESMIRVGFEDRLNSYRTRGYSVIAENYVPDADEPYVEYTLEKDGDTIQYVHTGKVFLSNDE